MVLCIIKHDIRREMHLQSFALRTFQVNFFDIGFVLVF
jgi:hypothetical protein